MVTGVGLDTRSRDVVFILGAGLNQALGEVRGQRPPMALDLFQVALNIRSGDGESLFAYQLDPLFDYIQRYWRLSPEDLASDPFDLEKFFAFTDERLLRGQDVDTLRARQLLTALLAEVLQFFETWARSPTMERFGRMLYRNRPTVLTFNYDTIVEKAIVDAAGLDGQWPPEEWVHGPMHKTDLTDAELTFGGGHRVKLPRLYGFKFDEVQLRGAGTTAHISGQRYYSAHPLYGWRFLKLHGSLNWYRFTEYRQIPAWPGQDEPVLPEARARAVVFEEGWWHRREPPDLDGWYLTPVLIPPTPFKYLLMGDPFFEPLKSLWKDAEAALRECRRLVVAGYSVPATDVTPTNLLRGVFAEKQLHELVVINPNDEARDRLIDLTHPTDWRQYRDLPSYLAEEDWEDAIDSLQIAGAYWPRAFPWVADRRETELAGRLEMAPQTWLGADGSINVRWVFLRGLHSMTTLQKGWRFDVELMRPNSSQFTALLTGTLGHGMSFFPDAGPGRYRFRIKPMFGPQGVEGDWTETDDIAIESRLEDSGGVDRPPPQPGGRIRVMGSEVAGEDHWISLGLPSAHPSNAAGSLEG